eukprot:Nk52_evm7s261 gene=Nk52_evmTU7s261
MSSKRALLNRFYSSSLSSACRCIHSSTCSRGGKPNCLGSSSSQSISSSASVYNTRFLHSTHLSTSTNMNSTNHNHIHNCNNRNQNINSRPLGMSMYRPLLMNIRWRSRKISGKGHSDDNGKPIPKEIYVKHGDSIAQELISNVDRGLPGKRGFNELARNNDFRRSFIRSLEGSVEADMGGKDITKLDALMEFIRKWDLPKDLKKYVSESSAQSVIKTKYQQLFFNATLLESNLENLLGKEEAIRFIAMIFRSEGVVHVEVVGKMLMYCLMDASRTDLLYDLYSSMVWHPHIANCIGMAVHSHCLHRLMSERKDLFPGVYKHLVGQGTFLKARIHSLALRNFLDENNLENLNWLTENILVQDEVNLVISNVMIEELLSHSSFKKLKQGKGYVLGNLLQNISDKMELQHTQTGDCETLMKIFKRFFEEENADALNWSVISTRAKSTDCGECGSYLLPTISAEEEASLKSAYERALSSMNASELVGAAKGFYSRVGKVDIIIDGMNIAHNMQSSFNVKQLVWVANNLQQRGYKIAIVIKKHLVTDSVDLFSLAPFVRQERVFAIDGGMDDQFFIALGFLMGPGTTILTNDMLRDHLAVFTGRQADLFAKWVRTKSRSIYIDEAKDTISFRESRKLETSKFYSLIQNDRIHLTYGLGQTLCIENISEHNVVLDELLEYVNTSNPLRLAAKEVGFSDINAPGSKSNTIAHGGIAELSTPKKKLVDAF